MECATMTLTGNFNIVETTCQFCNKKVRSFWDENGTGMLPRPSIIMIAGEIFHTECWERHLAEPLTDETP